MLSLKEKTTQHWFS